MNERQSILLVDDDPEFCKAMKKTLEKSGYLVTLATDGWEALAAITGNVFDLVLSDLRMPNLNGIELMQEIKRKKINVPVVFITGYGEVESYMDLMNMGAFEYINKPVGKKEILRVIEKVLGTYASPPDISHAEPL